MPDDFRQSDSRFLLHPVDGEVFMNSKNQPEKGNLAPNLTMEEIFTRWPETIPVLLKHQAYCVGCSMASFDTLEDAARIYHLSLNDLLCELEQAIQRA